jgi:predicted PurR-regulated permease PerM
MPDSTPNPPRRGLLRFLTAEGDEFMVRARLEVPPRTIVTLAFGLFLIWLVIKLSSVLLLVFLALMLTAALDPFVTRMERRGWKRSSAVTALLVGLLVIVAGILALTVPAMIRDGQQLASDLPTYVERLRPYFRNHPETYARLQDVVTRRSKDPSLYLSHARTLGQTIGSILTQLILLLTMTAYLLIADGERMLFWLFRYLPAKQQVNIRKALPELSRVVGAYLTGQLITSALFAAFAVAVCLTLSIPEAILLALLAFVADAIPLVGALIATVPAVLLAWTVSPSRAIVVLILYMVYQQIENHFIVPRVYKNTLQISSFGVLLSVAIGAHLLGIIGALVALPIGAVLPVIERIWREEQPTAPSPAEIGLAPAPWQTDQATGSPD